MATIKELKKDLEGLHTPFAGMLSTQAEYEAEQERNIDHGMDQMVNMQYED